MTKQFLVYLNVRLIALDCDIIALSHILPLFFNPLYYGQAILLCEIYLEVYPDLFKFGS